VSRSYNTAIANSEKLRGSLYVLMLASEQWRCIQN